ncbi:MAG: ABC transporter permease, partial [Flavobacteriales bacterium]|nr:ABC transporter permease [Flavobacteriales bacterium]
HKVHPDDSRAVWVRNNNEEFSMFLDIFKGIEVFIWGIGFFTLFAGMIGVANIMAIVVKERTKEIGIRKALGAPPATIISQIIQESTFLTFVSGCIGLVFGILILKVLAAELEHDFFSNPRVSPWIS